MTKLFNVLSLVGIEIGDSPCGAGVGAGGASPPIGIGTVITCPFLSGVACLATSAQYTFLWPFKIY